MPFIPGGGFFILISYPGPPDFDAFLTFSNNSGSTRKGVDLSSLTSLVGFLAEEEEDGVSFSLPNLKSLLSYKLLSG